MALPLAAFANEITFAAVANVQLTLEDLKAEFTRETGIGVKTVIGSSGKLTSQAESGGTDNDFHRRTWYQYVLYRPFSWLPAFEPAYRYEEFTIDTDRPNSTLSRHTIGFNYYLHTNVKFTANYEIRHDENGGGDTNANNSNFFTTQIQFRF